MKVFYHSADIDGQCSGAIVKAKYPEATLDPTTYIQSLLREYPALVRGLKGEI